jgi:hypothetical protein
MAIQLIFEVDGEAKRFSMKLYTGLWLDRMDTAFLA